MVLPKQQYRAQHESSWQLLGYAVAKSFLERADKKRIYKTRDLARADIFNYIEMFLNPTRCHSHLGGISPEAFESASFIDVDTSGERRVSPTGFTLPNYSYRL